jgi:hypothetical protein
MESGSPARSSWFGALWGAAGLAASVWLAYLALSQRLPAPPAAGESRGLTAAPALAPCVMDRQGYWKGRVFGSESLDINWSGEALGCAGNARPGGGGLRLFFAGHPAADEDRLVMVLGIGAAIDELAGREYPVSVTLIDEATSQFFHAPGDRCFTRIREVTPLEASPGSYRIEGDLYCAGAIASVSGANSVTLGDMSYAGRLTLDSQ